MAIITRPNIIFVILKLLRFLTNPNPIYIETVNEIINYLLRTRTLRLKLKGRDEFKIVTDTSFTNNINNRKNSQGYTIRLFKGLIT